MNNNIIEEKNKTEKKEKEINQQIDKDKEEIMNKHKIELENKEKKIQELESKIKELETYNTENQKIICELNNTKEENKKEFERQKIVIKEEIEKALKEKYDNLLETTMNEMKKSFERKLSEKSEDIKKKYEDKLKQKDKELNEKFNEKLEAICIKKKANENENENNNITHNGYKCEKCNQEPIIGIRYKCSECEGYNLCEKCEEENSKTDEHPHNFIKIRKGEENDEENIITEITEIVEEVSVDPDRDINEENPDYNEHENNKNDNIKKDDDNKEINENAIKKNEDNNEENNHIIIVNENNNSDDEKIKNEKEEDKKVEEKKEDEKKEEDNNSEKNDEENKLEIKEDIINQEKEDDNAENKYSYECITNIVNLCQYIYEGTDEAKIEIELKNNGKKAWPKDETKLIYDKESYTRGEDIILNPQNPGEEKKYEIIFNNLEKCPVGEYKFFLYFSVGSKIFGEKLSFRVNIKEEEKQEFLIIENSVKIKEFRDNFGLKEEEYSDEQILNALKQNDFDFEQTFKKLFE